MNMNKWTLFLIIYVGFELSSGLTHLVNMKEL